MGELENRLDELPNVAVMTLDPEWRQRELKVPAGSYHACLAVRPAALRGEELQVSEERRLVHTVPVTVKPGELSVVRLKGRTSAHPRPAGLPVVDLVMSPNGEPGFTVRHVKQTDELHPELGALHFQAAQQADGGDWEGAVRGYRALLAGAAALPVQSPGVAHAVLLARWGLAVLADQHADGPRAWAEIAPVFAAGFTGVPGEVCWRVLRSALHISLEAEQWDAAAALVLGTVPLLPCEFVDPDELTRFRERLAPALKSRWPEQRYAAWSAEVKKRVAALKQG